MLLVPVVIAVRSGSPIGLSAAPLVLLLGGRGETAAFTFASVGSASTSAFGIALGGYETKAASYGAKAGATDLPA